MIIKENDKRVLILGKCNELEEHTARNGKKYLTLKLRNGRNFHYIGVFGDNVDVVKYYFFKGKTMICTCFINEYQDKETYAFEELIYADVNGLIFPEAKEEVLDKQKEKVDEFFNDDDSETIEQEEDLDLPF